METTSVVLYKPPRQKSPGEASIYSNGCTVGYVEYSQLIAEPQVWKEEVRKDRQRKENGRVR